MDLRVKAVRQIVLALSGKAVEYLVNAPAAEEDQTPR